MRCAKGIETTAAKLLNGCTLPIGNDGPLICQAIEQLVEDGWLKPVRHTPWMPQPVTMHLSFAARRETKVDKDWSSKVSPATEWTFMVLKAPESSKPGSVSRDGRGWHCSNAPLAAFFLEEEARVAASLVEAVAYSFSRALRTLASGHRLIEDICRYKVVNNIERTEIEREWLDLRIANREKVGVLGMPDDAPSRCEAEFIRDAFHEFHSILGGKTTISQSITNRLQDERFFKAYLPGDKVRLSGRHLASTGQTATNSRTSFTVKYCECSLCSSGDFVAVDEERIKYDDESPDASPWRHIGKDNLSSTRLTDLEWPDYGAYPPKQPRKRK